MSTSSKQAVIPIMNNQYAQIAELEAQWNIRFSQGDHRPRIDHFHDAVRALTSGEGDVYGRGNRLAVEYLAYDVACLRQVQIDPVGKFYGHIKDAKGDALATLEDAEYFKSGAPTRAAKADLKQWYKDYTVLFVALFAEIADINFKTRSEEVDNAVEDIAMVEQILTKLASGQMNAQQAQLLLEQVEEDRLRDSVQALISRHNIQPSDVARISGQLGQYEQQIEAEKRTVETAHLNYVTSQLAVYEEAKDTIKRLAAQGMNLAGKFVENAVNQAGKGQGRGH